MNTLVRYFDSEDPGNRLRMIELVSGTVGGQRGTLYRCEREHPSDVWPAAVRVGRGYSLASAARIAKDEGLVVDPRFARVGRRHMTEAERYRARYLLGCGWSPASAAHHIMRSRRR